MKIVNMRFMAMLVLGFLPIATKALNCSPPPVPATRAWVDNITSGSDSGCTVVNGDLHLGRWCNAYNECYGGSASLEGAVDLGAVKTITGRLTCWGNPNITTVTANNLTNAGAVKISYTKLSGTAKYNTLLTGFSFPALVTVSGAVYGRGVYIWFNPALTSMGLGALQTIGAYLSIYGNKALTSVGLGALQTIEGYLRIGYNAALTSMGLGALKRIGDYLHIEYNDALTSMDLGALQTIEGFLNIREHNNPLDIEVNEKSPLLVCAHPWKCPGTVLTVLTIAPPTMQPTALPTMHPTGAEKYEMLENTRIPGQQLGSMNSTDLGACMDWCDKEKECTGFHVRDEQCIMKQKKKLRSDVSDSTAFVKQDVWGEMEVRSEDPDDPDASSDSDDVDVVNTAPRATGPTGAGAALLFLLPLLY